MAGKARALKLGKIGFCKADGTVVPWDSLTPAEVAHIHAGWQKKLSETMSAYYTEHPEEFAALQDFSEPETKASVPGGHPDTDKKTQHLQAGHDNYITSPAELQA